MHVYRHLVGVRSVEGGFGHEGAFGREEEEIGVLHANCRPLEIGLCEVVIVIVIVFGEDFGLDFARPDASYLWQVVILLVLFSGASSLCPA